jgi:hypothetical protein
MILDGKNYVPTLAIRASEMNGLEFLPGATKDRITPCVLLAPWANSNCIERALDRIERAFPNRDYFLDLDRDYNISNIESHPQQQLVELLNPSNSFSNWIEFVEKRKHILPCIQFKDQEEIEIRRQIERIQEINRPYCLRIQRDRYPNNFEDIISALSASGSADYVIIIEGGWTKDPLTLFVWFQGLISSGLKNIDASIPIVISCTSIPKMFTEFLGIEEVSFSNRELVKQITRQSNRNTIIYGDWGSTRPRESSGYASRPIDRIDYPTNDSWFIVRNKNEAWNFKDAAEKLIENKRIWQGNLNIWGEEMIFHTTINEEIGINTPQKNVAARVNIHLHRQAFYDQSDMNTISLDEDWED